MTKFLSVLLLPLFAVSALCAFPQPLTAVNTSGASVAPSTFMLGREFLKGWQSSKKAPELVFRPDALSSLSASPAYLRIAYLDRGYGRLHVEYKTAAGSWREPDKFTHPVFLNSGAVVNSFLRLPDLDLKSPEFRISRRNSAEKAFVVASAALQQDAFADPQFQYVLREDWKRPYAGPSAPGIDNRTLKGRVMVGYQGWFRTPNDPADVGWVHWGPIPDREYDVDMWPDVSKYPASGLDKANEVKTLSGKPGYLFSSAWPEIVRTHFAWMRKNDIDGAFLQRFLTDGTYPTTGRPEWVMGNIREAANKEGRIWAVEYDVSGVPDDRLLDLIKKDWAWLIDQFGLRKDPSYAHEKGKLVVFVWGMPLPDRHISVGTANAVVDFLKNDPVYGGNYVIGGLPGRWRDLGRSGGEHIKRYDGVLAWMSRAYADDLREFSAIGLDYYPHVWPGFSWANLQHIQTGSKQAYDPRAGGKFYEDLLNKVTSAGVDRLFVGMFDEYNEGTAVMPMSDDPPPTPERPGAYVEYFAGPNLDGRREEGNPKAVDLPLGDSPPANGIPARNFSARIQGQIVPPSSGKYTFRLSGAPGDSAKLQAGDQRVEISNAGDSSGKTVSLPLIANQRVIYQIEYRHAENPGAIQLLWSGPSIAEQPIPAAALVDAWGRFLTNEGHPSDWWLQLTAGARKQLRQ